MDRNLTPTELEMMKILWELQNASVNDIMSRLPDERKLAYTSVSTILRILEQKEVVKSVKEGRGHIYVPVMAKENFEKLTVNELVSKVFDGDSSTLVKHLVDKDMSRNEIENLKKFFEEKLKNK